LEDMDTEVLKKMVMDDMDSMEACEIIGGKNTNKKLRGIFFAHQENKLAEYVAANMPKEENKEGTTPAQGEIPINKSFDQKPKDVDKEADDFLNAPMKEKKTEEGNKYRLDVPNYDKDSERDFALTKTLYNKMVGIDPQITSPRYLILAEKLGLLEKYKDKETFCKYATVSEINSLLNTN